MGKKLVNSVLFTKLTNFRTLKVFHIQYHLLLLATQLVNVTFLYIIGNGYL